MGYDLRLGDCLDPATGLAVLADKSIDVVITDPPYSEHVHAKSRAGASTEASLLQLQPHRRHLGISRSRDLGFEAVTQDQMEGCSDQFARLAKRWVVVFCDVESAHLWRGALTSTGGLEYIRTLFWHKVGAAPQFTGDRPASGIEAMVLAHPKGRKRWGGGGKDNVYRCLTENSTRGAERVHTTQKPVVLMEQLVRDFSLQGETVLDPFAGSGTTGVAALALDRGFVGWERDAAYHALASERIGSTRPLDRGFIVNSAKNAAQGSLL